MNYYTPKEYDRPKKNLAGLYEFNCKLCKENKTSIGYPTNRVCLDCHLGLKEEEIRNRGYWNDHDIQEGDEE